MVSAAFMAEILKEIVKINNMKKYFGLIISPLYFLRVVFYFIFLKDMIYNNLHVVFFNNFIYFIFNLGKLI